MRTFERMKADDHEQLIFCNDITSGLKAIIAIHDTTLGPAIGGVRMWNYASEKEAVADALRIAELHTYRASIMGCDLGGGAIVAWGNPKTDKSEIYFRALGRFIEGLKGRFWTTTEMGTTVNDLLSIRRETQYVFGLPGAWGGGGDTSIITAKTALWGLRACLKEVFGSTSSKGKTVAIQGVGKVGGHIVQKLIEEEANIIMSDINYDRIKTIQDKFPHTKIIHPDEILEVKCDVLIPCAFGGVLTSHNINKLRCKIIAGPANNVLESADLAEMLYKKGILFAPDFLMGGGEMLQAIEELKGFNKERAFKRAEDILDIFVRILSESVKQKQSPYDIAMSEAKARIVAVGKVQQAILC